MIDEKTNDFALALSSGFGVLMIFEAVNVFDARLGAVLLALSFGYLFAGVSRTVEIRPSLSSSRKTPLS
ncbi:hypothetical protein [Halostagnicola sp. A-GB9-2]|uniref:hypothetical protein n=1 Tax=Halostagnicola sp. A-GB9-2 TaxID=3048066 RepID=UPI0024BFE8F9|nr:hypothetical protein [Halostagnicola sp. A-GB9-2]MDJ1433109.1 hypothetical protein [Halostagnicola sp. A-GB9-2]